MKVLVSVSARDTERDMWFVVYHTRLLEAATFDEAMDAYFTENWVSGVTSMADVHMAEITKFTDPVLRYDDTDTIYECVLTSHYITWQNEDNTIRVHTRHTSEEELA